jgi:hypothetical protein
MLVLTLEKIYIYLCSKTVQSTRYKFYTDIYIYIYIYIYINHLCQILNCFCPSAIFRDTI